MLLIWQYKRDMEVAAQAERLENELTRSRIAVMLAQIQPHFIYNALATIKALCAENPDAAEDAIAHFAKYLRGNMDSLSESTLVPFTRELQHLKNYVYLAKLRFGDKLNFVYDIRAEDFYLPPLSIQPIVENSVQYGVAKKGGGTVKISTEEDENGITITVSDDGSGFDFENSPRDGRSHIGIKNTRNRLSLMCGGTLTIDGRPGEGTTATIFIPRSENE